MRFTTGILLAALLSPLAHAELIDDVNDRGELRIAVQADSPPFTFKNDGKLSGFEIELGELLARELDVNPSFIETDSAEMLSGVESGKYDIAIVLSIANFAVLRWLAPLRASRTDPPHHAS